MGCVGGLREGQGQSGGCGCRRGVDRRVREGSEREPLQALESDVLGELLPAAGAAVEIPKAGGKGVRLLGVPTVADRIAQTVVRLYLEPEVEPLFHPDSYGYRPGRSALDAVATCRQRCWKKDWVIDLDIRAFFDSLDHDLVMLTVSKHTDLRWVLLYVERWLKAPLQMGDGTLVQRDRGTPQGSAISPLLANLFLHYAFDMWLTREFPTVGFERYADDAVVHCETKAQAQHVLGAIAERMAQVGLELHPDKTRIVYCKDATARAHMSTNDSASWGTRFVPDWRRAGTGTSS